MGSNQAAFGVTLGSTQGLLWVDLGPTLARSGVYLRWVWGRDLGSIQGRACRSGINPGSIWGRTGLLLEPIWARSVGVDLESTLSRTQVDEWSVLDIVPRSIPEVSDASLGKRSSRLPLSFPSRRRGQSALRRCRPLPGRQRTMDALGAASAVAYYPAMHLGLGSVMSATAMNLVMIVSFGVLAEPHRPKSLCGRSAAHSAPRR